MEAEGWGIDLVVGLNEMVIPQWPGLTILFDIPVEIALRRMGNRIPDRLEGEGYEFLCKVREAYLVLARRETERIKVVDSSGEFAVTVDQVRVILNEYLSRIGRFK